MTFFANHRVRIRQVAVRIPLSRRALADLVIGMLSDRQSHALGDAVIAHSIWLQAIDKRLHLIENRLCQQFIPTALDEWASPPFPEKASDTSKAAPTGAVLATPVSTVPAPDVVGSSKVMMDRQMYLDKDGAGYAVPSFASNGSGSLRKFAESLRSGFSARRLT